MPWRARVAACTPTHKGESSLSSSHSFSVPVSLHRPLSLSLSFTHTHTHTHSHTHTLTHEQDRTEYLKKCIADKVPLYAIIDGNHRIAALMLLALDAAYTPYSLETQISVVPHVPHSAIPLCRAVSALMNETHYMARASSFLDCLSYLHDTLAILSAAGCRVKTEAALKKELKAAGVEIHKAKSGTHKDLHSNDARTGVSENHLRLYWEWLAVLSEDGMARLLELQDMNAQAVYEQICRDSAPINPAPGPVVSFLHWCGELGGFVPRLGTRTFTPGRTNRTFVGDAESDTVVGIVERGWAYWVSNGGRVLSREAWLVCSPHATSWRDIDGFEVGHLERLIAADMQSTEDLAFIYDLMAAAPASDNPGAATAYCYMQHSAILSNRGRLQELIDDWHAAHPASPQSTTGLTITGYESKKAKSMMLAEEQKQRQQRDECHASYLLMMGKLDAVAMDPASMEHEKKVTEFKNQWALKGYKHIHTYRMCVHACKHSSIHPTQVWSTGTHTPLLQAGVR